MAHEGTGGIGSQAVDHGAFHVIDECEKPNTVQVEMLVVF
jgi:hypothetical protein